MTALSQRIWNLSRLSFDGSDRTNFLYRHDVHRHFVVGSGKNRRHDYADVINVGSNIGEVAPATIIPGRSKLHSCTYVT